MRRIPTARLLCSIFLASVCVFSFGCGGSNVSAPEQGDVECGWVVGTGVSDEDGLVTIDMGDLGTFRAHVRDGLTSEPLSDVQYVCVADACRDDASYLAVAEDGHQVGIFTRLRDDVIGGGVPGQWDELYPWMGGSQPIAGIHGVASISSEAWEQILCSATQLAEDTVAEMGDGQIAGELGDRASGLLLATSGGGASSSVLVHVCYVDDQSPEDVLADIQAGIYLARGYCGTQEVRLVETDGPCSSRLPMSIPVIEPVSAAPACVTTSDGATVYGIVRDAVTGLGVADASVVIGGVQITSGADGTYEASDVTPGEYVLVTAAAAGYQPFSAVMSLDPGESREQDIVLVPLAQYAGQYRFVLTWGEEPRDLDSHLWVPLGAGEYEHVAFWNGGSLTAAPYAELDVDDMDSYGPETITLLPNYEGNYVYAVHHWYGAGTLATSGAVVQVYAGNDLRYVIDVPNDACGANWWWYVAELNAQTGALTLVNELQESPPLAYSLPRDLKK